MEQTEDGEQVKGVRKRLKRMEYTIIGEDWGEEKDLEDGDGDKDGGVYVPTTITPLCRPLEVLNLLQLQITSHP